MTPQLQQAIKMLQLSNLELSNFIDGEIQQNPLLERHELGDGDAALGNSSEREGPTPVERPERLTGDFTPDAAERWQPEWGDEGDRSVDFGGEPQSWRSEEHTSELQSRLHLVCRLLLEKKKK